MAAGLIGPRVRCVTAFWISPKCGNTYHAFLQEEPADCRTKAMALALKEGFGTRFEPLLVLADLLDEVRTDEQRTLPAAAVGRRSQLTVLSEILACGHIQQLQLYGVALPAKADPDGSWAEPAGIVPGTVRDRIEKLRSVSAADHGLDTVETRVIEATPDLPVFSTLYNNSVCNEFALRLAPRLRKQGWISDPQTLEGAIFRIVAGWNKKGIFLTIPLHTEHLDAMTEIIYERLL
jgi:hypothetical protein